MQPPSCLPPLKTIFRKRISRHKASSLAIAYAELEREWLSSSQRKLLGHLIQKHILPNGDIKVDSALCLGLGSFSKRSPEPLDFGRSLRSFQDMDGFLRSDLVYQTSESEDGDEQGSGEQGSGEQGSGGQNMGEDGGPRNMSLYQLLLFESVLRCLRSKFEIPYSIIQDPELTAADRAFLQERGHTVLPYPSRPGFSFRSGVDFPFDSSLLERISNETFSFAPNLDFSVVVDAILAFRPLLYYGHDMFLDGASPHLLHPNSTGHHLRPTYLALATTYTFTHAPLWGRPSTSYGFMYPTQPSLKTARKQQRRIARAEVEKESVMAVLTSVADRQAAEAKGQGLSELRLAIANIGGG